MTKRLAFALAGLVATQTGAAAQFDASIAELTVNQAQEQVSLTAGRATIVRTTVTLVAPPTQPLALDGLMRVYVDGVELPGSPIHSDNGPFPAVVAPDLDSLDGTLNFTFLPPESSQVVFEVEINPAGPSFVPEADTSNNVASTPALDFRARAVPEFAYAPIDYRPGGGAPNLPDPALIEPGVGDNFVNGIYPVADIEYHRTDAASKLWTASLAFSGSSLLNSLLVDWSQMQPRPDFLYGWVPGGLPYTGQALLNSPVAMGDTESSRHQRTFAHEVGHNVGLPGTNVPIGTRGLDVEHHLNVTEGVGVVHLASQLDIMASGSLGTADVWIGPASWEFLFNHPSFAPSAPAIPIPTGPTGRTLLIAGVWNRATGEVALEHVLEREDLAPTTPFAPAEAELALNAYADGRRAHRLHLQTVRESCASGPPHVEVGFWAVVPQGPTPIEALEVVPMPGIQAGAARLERSPNPPQVRFVSPGPDGDVSSGVLTVAWEAFDADDDPLTYYLRYSPDGVRYAPIASGLAATSIRVDLRELPAFVDGKGCFELLASDGLDSVTSRSPVLHGSSAVHPLGGNAPWVHVMTPDDGKTFEHRATAVLHSSGWDLEDGAIGDVVWSSDLDGVFATGRLTSSTGLSVGTHVVTATATDSTALQSSATTTITVEARGLPAVGYCTAGTSASGCEALLSAAGAPSATASTGFSLQATGVEGSRDGLFFFGTGGRQANPWGNGTSFQCVVPPVKRAGILTGAGTPGACDGAFAQDLNALWCPTCPKPGHNPGAGALVQAQLWYRDPQNTSNQTTSLSDALEFSVAP